MSIDDVRELVQSRLDDERAVREHRRGNGKDMLPWSNGYVMALQQVLDDMKNFEAQDAAHPDHSKLGPSACPACSYDPLKVNVDD